MSQGPLILWLVMELGRLYLTPAASEIVVTAFLGQSVTLPCIYSSWSHHSNSMCWGKGQCPKSRCTEEFLYTDGSRVLWKKSAKYALQGSIGRGDISLTIFNTNEGDSGVYCCRVEVPGWFNDVKKNIRLQLRRAPPTTRATTTRRPTTTTTAATTPVMTTLAVLPTTVMTTPEVTAREPPQTGTTTALTAVATTCPPTTLSSLPEEDTVLLTPELPTEGPILTAESETVIPSSTSQRSTEETSGDTALFTAKGWVVQSTLWDVSESVTSQPRASETIYFVQHGVESEQISMANNYELLMIIAPSLGLVFLLLLLAFRLRGKLMEASCFQKHTRLENVGEGKNVLNGREDEDGLFTL
ncbi:T-cell immunoglobulin and mucin domain-containing protein 4 isoform X2 [Camelus dromedarius]|uniref:T-cell immunoglobulin and mucin domain-containing protein 4 n=1 Tax=Camelus ferus TaxID=419612 RepID=UPI00057AEB0A|nr:T-cell immunoglobulin and mucin domain-containing protein 4 [Camelus ferus]XP_010968341.1 T-cell immunoglobulin and mucin domain-containing protein 4 [Camelus bactrianus]XP_010985553.1 T-cell immunoglobulin and mucin domain-containing protein 4 [Camelus dromedarius]